MSIIRGSFAVEARRGRLVSLLAVLLLGTMFAIVPVSSAGAVGGYEVRWTYGAGLNVRTGPTTSHQRVANLRDGTRVDLNCWEPGTRVGNNHVWYKLNAPVVGYATSAYITTPSYPLPGLPRCGAQARPRNGYPYPNAPDCDEYSGRGCVADSWGFYQGQCTSYVAHMLRQRGVAFTNWYRQPSGYRWGKAGQWQHAARRAGFAVDGRPRPGDVGEFSFHVVYVHEVRGDGSIVYSDMNHDYHNGFRGSVVAYPGTRAWPARFLHIAN